jgi:hypothetical protein
MHLLRKLWILPIILLFNTVSAQYTGVINSNKPGFSESPYSVGTGIYQLETSLFYRKTEQFPTFSRPLATGIDFLFRTSFFKEQLELNLNFAYQRGEIGFENQFSSSYFVTGIRNLSIGAKYLVYEQEYDDKSKEIRSWVERHKFDWKRLIPSVAVYAGVHTGVGDPIFYLYDQGGFSPKAGVLLQNDLTNDLNIVTNIYYDRITTKAPEWSYIITATYSINDRWSTFFENQTISNKFRVESNIGSGIAYLWNRNLQLNTSLRLIAEGASSKGYYASFGASYRLDRHADDFTEVDEFGNPIEEEVQENEKKGFFGRMFGKVRNIFGKGKKSSKQTKLKDKTIKSIRKNTNKDELTINNDTLQKVEKPIRTRPKRVRIKPGKYKEVKEKRKGFFGFLKGKYKEEKSEKDKKKEKEKIKNMSQKEVEKELKRLEKEEKKLKREQKKEEERKKREEAKKKKKKEKDKKKKKKEEENEEGSG